jgi:hypothetical protein
VSEDPAHRSYWRIGHRGDPLGFVPPEICEYNHRFDDLRHCFRTVYIAELAETSLRETLADFRPKLSTIRFFQREMGAAAGTDLPAWPITAAWRREHVLAPLRLKVAKLRSGTQTHQPARTPAVADAERHSTSTAA